MKSVENLGTNAGSLKCCAITVTEAGIKKLLLDLDTTEAPGPDGISPRILKELSAEIISALTLLYLSFLNTGVVPQD